MHKYSEHAPIEGIGAIYKCLSIQTDEQTKESSANCVKYNKDTDKFSDVEINIPIKQCIPVPYTCYDKDFRVRVDLAGRHPDLFLRMFYGNGRSTQQITGMMKDICDISMVQDNLSVNQDGPFPNTKVIESSNTTVSIFDNAAIMATYLSGDFTIEFWAYQTQDNQGIAIQFDHAYSYMLQINNINGKWTPYVGSNGSNWNILNGNKAYSENTAIDSVDSQGYCNIVSGKWQHVAFVHHYTYWYMFVDGVLSMIRQREGTWYQTTQPQGIQLYRGSMPAQQGGQWYGRLYDLRIWTTAKYKPEEKTTASQGTRVFTPETQPAI